MHSEKIFQERGQPCPREAGWEKRGQGCPRSVGCGYAALGLWAPLIFFCSSILAWAAASEAESVEADLKRLSWDEQMQSKASSVYGASKHEQNVTDAPSSVSIVTQQDIKQYGYRTLGDLLRSVRGFYVSYDRVYNSIGVRGVNRPGDFGGRVLINIDGHRLNEPIFGCTCCLGRVRMRRVDSNTGMSCKPIMRPCDRSSLEGDS